MHPSLIIATPCQEMTHCSCGRYLYDMTLADEDTNSILANNANYDVVADAGDAEDAAEELPPSDLEL